MKNNFYDHTYHINIKSLSIKDIRNLPADNPAIGYCPAMTQPNTEGCLNSKYATIFSLHGARIIVIVNTRFKQASLQNFNTDKRLTRTD